MKGVSEEYVSFLLHTFRILLKKFGINFGREFPTSTLKMAHFKNSF